MTTRIAIFSDLHGNSAATEAVLAAIDAEAPDAVYNLGDLVGYGAKPNETISLIRERGIPTIMGNYDDGVGFDRDDCGCAYKDKDEEARGQQSLFWTRAETTEENKAYLRTLLPEIRFEAEGKRFRFVHGSPRRMNEYLFEDRDPRSLARIAQGAETDVLVFGHTHKPWVREIEGVLFINDGSVGKPKDGDPRAAWALLTVGRWQAGPGRDPAGALRHRQHGRSDPRRRRLARSLCDRYRDRRSVLSTTESKAQLHRPRQDEAHHRVAAGGTAIPQCDRHAFSPASCRTSRMSGTSTSPTCCTISPMAGS